MNEGSKDFEVVREIGDLPADAIITEEGLAKMFSRHGASIRRAVERRELPPPTRMFGKPCWTVRAIREHVSQRLEGEKKTCDGLDRRLSQKSA